MGDATIIEYHMEGALNSFFPVLLKKAKYKQPAAYLRFAEKYRCSIFT